jgi:nucleoid-associated protein YgaU
MTSDAKIGLLLGLVFIFIIAFIINGLPSFSRDTNNNQLTTNMVDSQNSPSALAARERKVRREVIDQIESVNKQLPRQVQTVSTANQDVRFVATLPTSNPAVTQAVEQRIKTPGPSMPQPSEVHSNNIASSPPALPKVYVVREGDSLAVIVQKVYGPEEGNKTANINRIFKANSKLLKSPDEIYVGQKLIIPPLSFSAQQQNETASDLPETVFTKAESIGKRHSLNGSQETAAVRQHIVREGETLWQIAAEQLGDGDRYTEIAKLNADILDDEDELSIGMRLKLPAK